MRVLYLGMSGEFSYLPLLALLKAGVAVCGVVAMGEKTADSTPISLLTPQRTVSELSLINPFHLQHIVHLAWEHNIPAFEVIQLKHPDTVATLAALQPDVACVACFSRKIPPVLLALPRYGFLNVHPSLLPAYRGPAPLFWQFRQGEPHTGVTVHWMDEGLDTGDVVLQTAVSFPDGIPGSQADRLCAQAGGELLVQAIQQLPNGLPRLPQSSMAVAASYHPWPKTADFALSTHWSAKRAFNFIRGTSLWGMSYDIHMGEKRVVIETAVSYHPTAQLNTPLVETADELHIQFNPGVLYAWRPF